MKKILVIRYGALGDMVVTLPVLQSLKESNYYVTLSGNSQYRDFFLQYGYVDEFIPFDGDFFLPLFAGEPQVNVSRYLENFHIILAYTDESEPFSVALKRSFSGKIIFYPVQPSRINEHIISYLLQPVRGIASCIKEVPEIMLDTTVDRNYFVIHPGSGSIHKNWSKEKFLQLYTHLSQKKGGYILLGCAEDDMKNFWSRNVPAEKIINSPALKSLMNLVRKTELYIGNDSGISHIFSASGIPSVIIFGPTSPAVWSPKGKNVKIIYKEVDCSPCDVMQRGNCIAKKCLASITVSDVLKVVDRGEYGDRRNNKERQV